MRRNDLYTHPSLTNGLSEKQARTFYETYLYAPESSGKKKAYDTLVEKGEKYLVGLILQNPQVIDGEKYPLKNEKLAQKYFKETALAGNDFAFKKANEFTLYDIFNEAKNEMTAKKVVEELRHQQNLPHRTSGKCNFILGIISLQLSKTDKFDRIKQNLNAPLDYFKLAIENGDDNVCAYLESDFANRGSIWTPNSEIINKLENKHKRMVGDIFIKNKEYIKALTWYKAAIKVKGMIYFYYPNLKKLVEVAFDQLKHGHYNIAKRIMQDIESLPGMSPLFNIDTRLDALNAIFNFYFHFLNEADTELEQQKEFELAIINMVKIVLEAAKHAPETIKLAFEQIEKLATTRENDIAKLIYMKLCIESGKKIDSDSQIIFLQDCQKIISSIQKANNLAAEDIDNLHEILSKIKEMATSNENRARARMLLGELHFGIATQEIHYRETTLFTKGSAKEYFETALTLNPNEHEAHYYLGKLYSQIVIKNPSHDEMMVKHFSFFVNTNFNAAFNAQRLSEILILLQHVRTNDRNISTSVNDTSAKIFATYLLYGKNISSIIQDPEKKAFIKENTQSILEYVYSELNASSLPANEKIAEAIKKLDEIAEATKAIDKGGSREISDLHRQKANYYYELYKLENKYGDLISMVTSIETAFQLNNTNQSYFDQQALINLLCDVANNDHVNKLADTFTEFWFKMGQFCGLFTHNEILQQFSRSCYQRAANTGHAAAMFVLNQENPATQISFDPSAPEEGVSLFENPSAPLMKDEEVTDTNEDEKTLSDHEQVLKHIKPNKDSFQILGQIFFDFNRLSDSNISSTADRVKKLYSQYLPLYYWQALQFDNLWSNEKLSNLQIEEYKEVIAHIFNCMDNLIKEKEFEKAKTILDKLTAEPAVINAYLMQAKLFHASKKPLTALSELYKAVEKRKEYSQNRTTVDSKDSEKQSSLNTVLFSSIYTDISNQIASEIASDADSPALKSFCADAYYQLAKVAHFASVNNCFETLYNEDITNSIPLNLQRALENDPLHCDAIVLLSRIQYEKGKPQQAVNLLMEKHKEICNMIAKTSDKEEILKLEEVSDQFRNALQEIADGGFPEADLASQISELEKEKCIAIYNSKIGCLDHWNGKYMPAVFGDYVRHVINDRISQNKRDEAVSGMKTMATKFRQFEFACQYVNYVIAYPKQLIDAIHCAKESLALNQNNTSLIQIVDELAKKVYSAICKLDDSKEKVELLVALQAMYNLRPKNDSFNKEDANVHIDFTYMLNEQIVLLSNSASQGLAINKALETTWDSLQKIYPTVPGKDEKDPKNLIAQKATSLSKLISAKQQIKQAYLTVVDIKSSKQQKESALDTLRGFSKKSNSFANYYYGLILQKYPQHKTIIKDSKKPVDLFKLALSGGEVMAMDALLECYPDKISALPVLYDALLANFSEKMVRKFNEYIKQARVSHEFKPSVFTTDKTLKEELLIALLMNNEESLTNIKNKNTSLYDSETGKIISQLEKIQNQTKKDSAIKETISILRERLGMSRPSSAVRSSKEIEDEFVVVINEKLSEPGKPIALPVPDVMRSDNGTLPNISSILPAAPDQVKTNANARSNGTVLPVISTQPPQKNLLSIDASQPQMAKQPTKQSILQSILFPPVPKDPIDPKMIKPKKIKEQPIAIALSIPKQEPLNSGTSLSGTESSEPPVSIDTSVDSSDQAPLSAANLSTASLIEDTQALLSKGVDNLYNSESSYGKLCLQLDSSNTNTSQSDNVSKELKIVSATITEEDINLNIEIELARQKEEKERKTAEEETKKLAAEAEAGKIAADREAEIKTQLEEKHFAKKLNSKVGTVINMFNRSNGAYNSGDSLSKIKAETVASMKRSSF